MGWWRLKYLVELLFICTVLALLSSALFVELKDSKSYSGLLPMRERASRWIMSSAQVCWFGIKTFDKSLLAWEWYCSSLTTHSADVKHSDKGSGIMRCWTLSVSIKQRVNSMACAWFRSHRWSVCINFLSASTHSVFYEYLRSKSGKTPRLYFWRVV